MNSPQRGETYEVKPDPAIGTEIQETRPCVVVSSHTFNEHSALVVVCPITEGINLPADIIHIAIAKGEGGTSKDSIALCDQVKVLDQMRLMKKRGHLKAETMQKIDKGLRMVLGL